jgi:hypothetical protein
MKKAGREVSEAVSETARRMRVRQQAHRSSAAPMLRIKDPVTATATLILSIVSEGNKIPRNVESKLLEVLCAITDADHAVEAIETGKRLQGKTSRTLDVIHILGEFLGDRLTTSEQHDLIEMIHSVFAACPTRPAHISNHIVALRGVLGLNDHTH